MAAMNLGALSELPPTVIGIAPLTAVEIVSGCSPGWSLVVVLIANGRCRACRWLLPG